MAKKPTRTYLVFMTHIEPYDLPRHNQGICVSDAKGVAFLPMRWLLGTRHGRIHLSHWARYCDENVPAASNCVDRSRRQLPEAQP